MSAALYLRVSSSDENKTKMLRPRQLDQDQMYKINTKTKTS